MTCTAAPDAVTSDAAPGRSACAIGTCGEGAKAPAACPSTAALVTARVKDTAVVTVGAAVLPTGDKLTSLATGQQVTVRGLLRRTELNGSQGLVLARGAADRWAVRLEGADEPVSIRAENLSCAVGRSSPKHCPATHLPEHHAVSYTASVDANWDVAALPHTAATMSQSHPAPWLHCAQRFAGDAGLGVLPHCAATAGTDIRRAADTPRAAAHGAVDLRHVQLWALD